MSALQSKSSDPWWGAYGIPTGQGGRWRLGALTLTTEHRPFEVRFGWRASSKPQDAEVNFECPVAVPTQLEDGECLRVGLEKDEAELTLEPRLADRAVVARPSVPLTVLSRQTVNLYLTTPLWVQVTLKGHELPILDIPSIRMSDTWFGPSPREGEICYASRTQARLDQDRLTTHPLRATTRLVIHNNLKTPLLIERVKLPTAFLSLYLSDEGRLWTQAVHLDRHNEDEPASIRLDTPKVIKNSGAQRIAPPRQVEDANLFRRALGALIG